MPWLSPNQSPDASPRSKALSKLTNGASSATSRRAPTTPSITYIPPLIDGACGTKPNCQRSIVEQLSHDIATAARVVPSLIRGVSTDRMDRVEMVQHAALALFECYMFIMAIPLWLTLPGALFIAWVLGCSAMVMGMSWSLNGRAARGEVLQSSCPPSESSWMMGQDADDERWYFVAGMGTSAKSLTQRTLPALARLFNRTMLAVHAPTYGLPVDFLCLVLQRSLSNMFPSAYTRTLYAQIRTALLDSKTNRTVVLAHNAGAVTMSQVLRQLHADVPADKMSKLEIYTFGAATTDFSMPLGGPFAGPESAGSKKPGQSQVHAPEFVADRRPHVEHFAFSNDPFARMGVLHGVREDLQGRFCGPVFMLRCPGTAHHGPRAAGMPADRSSVRPLMSLNDYMSCLFPDQGQPQQSQPPSALVKSSKDKKDSILDGLMSIDRDLAEKREFAALASYSASVRGAKGEKKRLSWTGLGATAGGMNGNMDGLVGLDMARKGCKDCKGHRGREVSWLVRYVSIPSNFSMDLNSVPEA